MKLSVKQEKTLSRWTQLMHNWDWSPRVKQVRLMIMKLLRNDGQPDDMRLNWSQKFLHRHSKLISVFNNTLNKERAAMHDENVIKRWFQLFQNTVQKYDIQLQDTYNMNEKNFALRLQDQHRVICFKYHSFTLTQNDNKE